jgi:hypothetical protein
MLDHGQDVHLRAVEQVGGEEVWSAHVKLE